MLFCKGSNVFTMRSLWKILFLKLTRDDTHWTLAASEFNFLNLLSGLYITRKRSKNNKVDLHNGILSCQGPFFVHLKPDKWMTFHECVFYSLMCVMYKNLYVTCYTACFIIPLLCVTPMAMINIYFLPVHDWFMV